MFDSSFLDPFLQAFYSSIVPVIFSIGASLLFLFAVYLSIIYLFRTLSLDVKDYGYKDPGISFSENLDHFLMSKKKFKDVTDIDGSHILDKETGDLLSHAEVLGTSAFHSNPMLDLQNEVNHFCEKSDLTPTECNEVVSKFNQRYKAIDSSNVDSSSLMKVRIEGFENKKRKRLRY